MAESGSNPSPARDPFSASRSQSEQPGAVNRRQILIVEDNRADVFLIRESITLAAVDAELHVVSDGEKAIQFFEYADADPSAPCPDLVLLDINLPKREGREVLHHMKNSRRCAQAAVLVVTSSDSERDREDMAKFGVKGYFRKPSEYDSFIKLGELVKALLQGEPPAHPK